MDALLGVSALVFPVAPPMGYAPSIEGKAGALLAEKNSEFCVARPYVERTVVFTVSKDFHNRSLLTQP